jgi:hypothetical protein
MGNLKGLLKCFWHWFWRKHPLDSTKPPVPQHLDLSHHLHVVVGCRDANTYRTLRVDCHTCWPATRTNGMLGY